MHRLAVVIWGKEHILGKMSKILYICFKAEKKSHRQIWKRGEKKMHVEFWKCIMKQRLTHFYTLNLVGLLYFFPSNNWWFLGRFLALSFIRTKKLCLPAPARFTAFPSNCLLRIIHALLWLNCTVWEAQHCHCIIAGLWHLTHLPNSKCCGWQATLAQHNHFCPHLMCFFHCNIV